MSTNAELKPGDTPASGAPLDLWLGHLKRLARLLGDAQKHRSRQPSAAQAALAEAMRVVDTLDWTAVRTVLQKEHDELGEKHSAELQARRETLLKAAEAASVPAEMRSRADRIGIFNVSYEGVQVVVTLGSVRITAWKEADGQRLFERLQKLRQTLEQAPFARETFFKLLKAGYATTRRLGGSGDEFVPLRDLHRELVFERARLSEKFRRSPDPKNLDSYPLFQFVFDLARFLAGGVNVGEERLQTQTPSMRENKETAFIPNLEHPLAAETPVARLAIKPV